MLRSSEKSSKMIKEQKAIRMHDVQFLFLLSFQSEFNFLLYPSLSVLCKMLLTGKGMLCRIYNSNAFPRSLPLQLALAIFSPDFKTILNIPISRQIHNPWSLTCMEAFDFYLTNIVVLFLSPDGEQGFLDIILFSSWDRFN